HRVPGPHLGRWPHGRRRWERPVHLRGRPDHPEPLRAGAGDVRGAGRATPARARAQGAADARVRDVPEATVRVPVRGWPRVFGAAAILLLGASEGRAGAAQTGTPPLVAQAPRLVVLDLPYEKVWANTLRALDPYPIERSADGVGVIRRVERAARAAAPGFELC